MVAAKKWLVMYPLDWFRTVAIVSFVTFGSKNVKALNHGPSD